MIHYSKRKDSIKWIVVHYPVMTGATAERVKAFFENTKERKSTHYAVSDTQTVSIVPCEFAAWHCSTYRMKVYCGANNHNSIGIDLVENKVNRKSKSVVDKDWFFSDSTLERGAILIAYLMHQYNIDIDHVVRHYDVTHKRCPRPFVGNDINIYWGVSGEQKWQEFKQMVQAKL